MLRSSAAVLNRIAPGRKKIFKGNCSRQRAASPAEFAEFADSRAGRPLLCRPAGQRRSFFIERAA